MDTKSFVGMGAIIGCLSIYSTAAVFWVLTVVAAQAYGQTHEYAKQGFSSRLCFDNRGSFGQVCYPGVIGGTSGDSVGLAYPIGQPYEHIFGAGLWIGGKLDTARVGTSPQVTCVTVGYEGWSWPYFEFWPRSSPADTIWEVIGRGVPRPNFQMFSV